MDNPIIGIRFYGNRKTYYFNNPTNYPFKKNNTASVIGVDGCFNEVVVVSLNKSNFKPTKDIYPIKNTLSNPPAFASSNGLPDL